MGKPGSEIESLPRHAVAPQLDERLARRIVETCVDGTIAVDDRGAVLSFNAAAERIFGCRAAETIGRDVKTLIPEPCHRVYDDCLAAYRRTNEARIVGIDQELLGRRKDGSTFPMEAALSAFVLDGRRTFTITARDVTERRQALDQRLLLAAVLADSNDAVTVHDFDGRITAWNRGAARMYGHTETDALGMNIRAIVPKAAEAEAMAFLAQLAGGAQVDSFETQRVTRDGRVLDVWLTITILRDDRGKPIAVATTERDVTERNKAEQVLRDNQQRLRSLTSALSLAEERERRRIASDLHEQVGGTLAAVKIKLGQLLQAAAAEPGFDQALREIRELIETTIRTTRSLTFDLASPILYEIGLEAALERLADELQEQHGVRRHFEDDGRRKPMPHESQVVLFHTVRELLTNVAKHAHAGSVHVSIRRDGSDVRIDVEDDGVGFETPDVGFHVSRSGGFGLFHAGQRLTHLGGSLEVRSASGHGTTVTVIAPLAGASPANDTS